MKEIQYREMREEDLPELARILGVTWHDDAAEEGCEGAGGGAGGAQNGEGGEGAGGNDAEGTSGCNVAKASAHSNLLPDQQRKLQELIGLADLGHMAQKHTFSQVAVEGSKPLGVVLARAGAASKETKEHWQGVLDRALSSASEIDAKEAQGYKDYMEAEHQTYAQLLDQASCSSEYELVLFIVSPEARGKGVGGQLMSRAKSYLKEAGATHAFLFTDTSCTWEYYERRGMRRAAEATTQGSTVPLPERMFVYEFSLEN